MEYPCQPREHLALLGLIASPLQMVWMYAHLRNSFAQANDLRPVPSPLEWLRSYQNEFLCQVQQLFHVHDQVPQMLHLRDPDGHDLAIRCPMACTAAQLLAAHRICLAWNEAGGILMDGTQLPLGAFLNRLSSPFRPEPRHDLLHPQSLRLASLIWVPSRCAS